MGGRRLAVERKGTNWDWKRSVDHITKSPPLWAKDYGRLCVLRGFQRVSTGPLSGKILLRKRFSNLLRLKAPDCSNTVSRFKCMLLDESPGEEKQMVA